MKKEISFVRLLSIIAILLLTVIMAVTSTFAWYPRTSSETDEMRIFRDRRSLTVVGHGKKEITTYIGANDNGHVTYDEVLSASNRVIPHNDENIYYFKTVVMAVLLPYLFMLTVSRHLLLLFRLVLQVPKKPTKRTP